MASPSLSLVIPTAGRSFQLEACLQSIAARASSAYPISAIVVDNNTDEKLAAFVKTLCGRFPGIKYVHCPYPGLSSARHHALKCIDDDILCYIDDDVRLSRSWVESTISAFQDPQVALAGGPSIPYFKGSVPAWLWDFFTQTPYGGWCCPWLSLLDIGRDIDNIQPNWIWGLNFAIRRDALLACDGFHVDLVPKQYMRWQGDGETGLTMKLAAKGYKAVYRQHSLLYHYCGPDRLNPEYFAKRAFFQGVCNSYTEMRQKLRGEHQFVPAHQPSSPIRRSLRYIAHTMKRKLTKGTEPKHPSFLWAEAAQEVRTLCNQAERNGYFFHQREANIDQALREWIRRDNYFDTDLRELAHTQPSPKDADVPNA